MSLKIILGPALQLKNMVNIIKDLVTLWTAPIDTPAIKSIKDASTKAGFKKDFTGYVFGNIILGKKS